MSFDVILQRFSAEPSAQDDDVLQVLEGFIEFREEDWVRLRTVDGEADLYGVASPLSGLMVNHLSGRAVWEVVFDLARSFGFAVMPVGCPTCVTEEQQIGDLPPELAGDAIVVSSGAELQRIVEQT